MADRRASVVAPVGARAGRRGFSLVELMLATALGALVVVGATSVLGLLARTEQTLSERHRQVAQIGTLHDALQDAFDALVVSDTAQPTPEDGEEDAEGRREPLAGARTREAIERVLAGNVDAAGEPVRPRMILAHDPDASARGAAHPGDAGAGAQFFELVVSRAPAGYALPERLGGTDRAQVQRTRLSPRGVLELRPDPSRPQTSILWWRPLQHDGSAFYDAVEGDRDQQALKLLEGVEALEWRVFIGGQRQETFMATWENELPAYVELELRTSAGLYANWMFEIGWSTGAERITPQDQDQDEDQDEQEDQQQDQEQDGNGNSENNDAAPGDDADRAGSGGGRRGAGGGA